MLALHVRPGPILMMGKPSRINEVLIRFVIGAGQVKCWQFTPPLTKLTGSNFNRCGIIIAYLAVAWRKLGFTPVRYRIESPKTLPI